MSASQKLDAHKDEIAAAYLAGTSQRALARKYGVARATLQEWFARNKLTAPAAPPQAPVNQVEILEAEVRELRQRVNKERRADVESERIFREIQQALTSAPVRYRPPSISVDGDKAHVQALLLSDLHAGEVVDPEAVNGLNEFNWDVLVKERMPSLQKSLLSFQANRPYPIDELQIWLLGDMCSGSNHHEIEVTNEFPAAEQGYRVGMLIGQWIEELVPYFPKIVVYGVPGNHPRLQKAPASKQVFNNFDWLAYKIAEVYLAGYIEQNSVEFTVTRAGFLIAEIAANNILLIHGDGIRSTMPGVPWGGVSRRWNELKKQYAEQGVFLHGMALGHFHQANVVQGCIFMNGSVKGVDEHVLKNFGAGERPTQLLLTWDPSRSRLTDVSYLNP